MATGYPAPVSALQVGSFFVQQYYQILQQNPEYAHQFYTEASTMFRVDGNKSESAASIMQIHALVTSLSFTEIEIKTANSLDSWNGGVLVVVSGSVQTKDYVGRRKFVQTFFLAPQEKGYFIYNDIFQFLDEEHIHQLPVAILAQNHFDAIPNPLPEPVSDYMIDGEAQARDFGSVHAVEEASVDKYSLPEQQHQQQYLEADNTMEELPLEESTNSFPQVMNHVQDSSPLPVEESVGEPQKHTYADIVRVSKGPSASSVTQRSTGWGAPPSEWNHASHTTSQQPYPATSQQSYPAPSMGFERPSIEVEEVATPDEEGEGRSVYVKNLPPTITSFEIEQEFKNFGAIKPDGVVIRVRKDVNVCYAFVEFEDSVGAQNAIQASSVQLSGRQVYIEERKPNSSSAFRGRRGRGRGGYQTESVRGRSGGRGYGRGSAQDGNDRDYNRARGNGFHPRVPRHEKGILGSQGRNGYNPTDDGTY